MAKIRDETRDAIANLIMLGWSDARIAAALGTARATARTIRRELAASIVESARRVKAEVALEDYLETS